MKGEAMVDLTEWKYVGELARGLYIYAKGKERVGVDKDGYSIISYKMGPDKSPRCQECFASRSTS